MDPRSIEIILTGPIPSKKNKLRRGRMGQGYHYDEATKACIQALEAQVPAAYRGLNLVHPTVIWQFTVPVRRQDRDALKTTVLDVLKNTGVIKDDNIANFNGKETTLPCLIRPSEDYSVRIRLRPAPDVLRAA